MDLNSKASHSLMALLVWPVPLKLQLAIGACGTTLILSKSSVLSLEKVEMRLFIYMEI